MVENKFPERLRRLRERVNRKQYAIAQCCNIDRKTLRLYEKGEMEPLMSQLISIANYYDVSIDYLVGRTDNSEIKK